MSVNTKIEWARHPKTGKSASWNPILAQTRTGKLGYHCEKKSPACANCYAENFNMRRLPERGTGLPFKPGHMANGDVKLVLDRAALLKPLEWNASRGVFVCSMTDLFAEFVPDTFIDQIFAVMALSPHHVFFVLTKRPDRMRAWCEEEGARIWGLRRAFQTMGCAPNRLEWPLPNVWMGTSVEDQEWAMHRMDDLLATPAALHWISAEPLLGPLFLDRWIDRLGWVVTGGESGRNARPSHPAWFRSLRDQCSGALVPFFFKQWGEYAPTRFDEDGQTADVLPSFAIAVDGTLDEKKPFSLPDIGVKQPRWSPMSRYGKQAAGRVLFGHEHNAMPEAST
ncbi:hypothetical protein IZ6_07370 [Terrihabitans soli]|uniref:Phage Gp37/Gp68 family protein n=1 Tax=Terrihabitans soli TaxID=708113 RepID=A0A6S6QRV0_9HYPH|nr:phage Gp37/Gp68 family protein [Terrihabitans soli]BCJ90002.1 hypothetical protein IZ6_07370 [Terrihabitans soli]